MCLQAEGHPTVRREETLWLLGSLCGLFRIPFSAPLIEQSYPPPYTPSTVLEAEGKR